MMNGDGPNQTVIPTRITTQYLAGIKSRGAVWKVAVQDYIEQLEEIRLCRGDILVIGRKRAAEMISHGDSNNAAIIEALCDEIEHLMGVTA